MDTWAMCDCVRGVCTQTESSICLNAQITDTQPVSTATEGIFMWMKDEDVNSRKETEWHTLTLIMISTPCSRSDTLQVNTHLSSKINGWLEFQAAPVCVWAYKKDSSSPSSPHSEYLYWPDTDWLHMNSLITDHRYNLFAFEQKRIWL